MTPVNTPAKDFHLRETDKPLLAEMPAHQVLLLTYRHQDRMTYEAIAAAAGIELGSVKSGLHRARQKLVTMREAARLKGETCPST